MVRIEGWARGLLERPHTFATLATVASDGWPHQAVVWYTLRDDHIIVNSAVGRRWPANLLRDPRFDFMVEDGYAWASIKGHAQALDDAGQALEDISDMARRYHDDDPEHAEWLIRERFARQDRISFALRPAVVTQRTGD